MKIQNKKNEEQLKFNFQLKVAIVGILLFVAKLIAWKLTNSDAVFSDAMESIVNIIAAFMGLYSLYLASKPKDHDHPYGHGKIEFITSGIEGVLIIIAAILILVESFQSLIYGKELEKLDYGIVIIALTAIINYFLGYISYKKGIEQNSVVLQSSGKHLQSDTITTAGVVLSLVLVYFTKLYWIDAVVAATIGGYIIFIGYGILRKSLSGIMDEADHEMLQRMAEYLNQNRKSEWIDLHNVRIQQHGSKLHIDGHLTLPYYFELRKAHQKMEEMIVVIAKSTRRNIEFNIHMDDCKKFSCEICRMENCPVRELAFVKTVEWNLQNISQPDKHTKDTKDT